MKTNIVILAILSAALTSCNFSRSMETDFATGMTTVGNGLSCGEINLSDGENKINRSTFTFGEKIYVNFEDIEGFNKEDGNVFPGLEFLIINKSGDTILHNKDLYASNENGFDISPLLLQASITIGKPILSNNEYILNINIWDKKGEGEFTTEMEFDVVTNDQIKIKKKDISYDEIYLFSRERKKVIINNKSKLNEDLYLIFEGLKGFVVEDDKASIGLSIKATDANGETILNEEDLIADEEMHISDFSEQLAPSLVFSGENINNPVTCHIVIWDKKSDHKIQVNFDLDIEQ